MSEMYRILQTDDIAGVSIHNIGHVHCSEFTTLDSPCEQALIDFRHDSPALASPDISIDNGLQLIRCRNGSELMVVDEQTLECRGLISARDIVSEKPIRFAAKYRKTRAEITVGDLMEPVSHLRKVDSKELTNCKIGDIVKTLKSLRHEYLMVTTAATRWRTVLGYFSIAHIGSELDTNFDAFSRARSFAELAYVLHQC